MVTEEMIRAALERVAERAPDGVAVRAALAGRARLLHQRRTLVLAGGAAAATVATGVPAAALWLRRNGSPVAPSGPAQPPNRRFPLRWRPTWLPNGLVELHRSTKFDDEVTEWVRGWGPRPADDASQSGLPAVALRMTRESALPEIGRPVSINGTPGRLHNDPGAPECGVLWLAAPGQLLTASITKMSPTKDPEESSLRIARSVVADPAAVCEVWVAFGWLPAGYGDAARSFSLGASVKPGQPVTPTARIERLFLHPTAESGAVGSLTIGEDRPRPQGAQDVTVRGRPGWMVWNEHDESVVYVPLEDGRPLVMTVKATRIGEPRNRTLPPRGRSWTREELLRVVDEVRLGPIPDLSWFGRR